MHTKDARAIGETEQRLYALTAWRDTPFFTDRERAALAFTEAVTLMTADHVPAPAYDAVAAQFTRRGRRAAGLDRDHQRLERHRREHPCVAARQLPALTSSPGRLGEQDASGSARQPPAHR
jgi:hypothetical protein